MLGKLKTIIMGNAAYAETANSPEDREQLALASLLVEMAQADFDEAQAEHAAIVELLEQHFELSHDEAIALMQKARNSNDSAVCLFDYTRALHQALDAEQRLAVIRLLWQVALADSRLDKYEDYLVRKVADLLYVPDSDVIRIKHEVLDGQAAG